MQNEIGTVLTRRLGLWALVGTLVVSAGMGTGNGSERPRLHTNEAYVEEAMRTTTLAVDDPIDVLAFVLDGLPERVKVYPTENYYYFSFIHNGTPYAGEFLFDPLNRDDGKVGFGYYQTLTQWKDDESGVDKFLFLDASHGVKVERVERFHYRVSRGAKSVLFVLNDLSGVKPPQASIASDDRYLGPIFDESGIRFFLLYNAKIKIFYYVLDEMVKVADEFYASARTDRIIIGRRTGFAFYRDHRLDRKILIGAFEVNSHLNNYFDGPFDQLPENFIEGNELQEAIVDADPRVKGRIDRLGNYINSEGERYSIHPYMLYR